MPVHIFFGQIYAGDIWLFENKPLLHFQGVLRPNEDMNKFGKDPSPEGSPLYGLYRYVQPPLLCFLAILVLDRVSILAILVINRVWVLHSSLPLGMFYEEATFSSSLLTRPSKKPFINYV